MTKTLVSVTSIAALLATLALGNTTNAEDTKRAVKTGTVTGTVLDSAGKAVANVNVRIMPPRPERSNRPAGGHQNGGGKPVAPGDDTPPPPPADGTPPPPDGDRPARPKPLGEAKTDAEGKFTIENVPVGEHRIVCNAKGEMANETITVKEGETVTASLSLKKAERPARNNGGAKGGRRGQ